MRERERERRNTWGSIVERIWAAGHCSLALFKNRRWVSRSRVASSVEVLVQQLFLGLPVRGHHLRLARRHLLRHDQDASADSSGHHAYGVGSTIAKDAYLEQEEDRQLKQHRSSLGANGRHRFGALIKSTSPSRSRSLELAFRTMVS